jgi:hypothetical protein
MQSVIDYGDFFSLTGTGWEAIHDEEFSIDIPANNKVVANPTMLRVYLV